MLIADAKGHAICSHNLIADARVIAQVYVHAFATVRSPQRASRVSLECVCCCLSFFLGFCCCSLRTTLCVRFKSETVACGLIFMAARRLQVGCYFTQLQNSAELTLSSAFSIMTTFCILHAMCCARDQVINGDLSVMPLHYS